MLRRSTILFMLFTSIGMAQESIVSGSFTFPSKMLGIYYFQPISEKIVVYGSFLTNLSILEKEKIHSENHFIIRRGAGAYICGEESAMIESIEGKRGLPRHRPPYVAESGLFGLPTLTNNLETLYWIRDIIERGSQWFAEKGFGGKKGFHSFSVSGRVKDPGVKVAPAGITIQEIIDMYCGGRKDGHIFKGYLPGGASGGILPASMNNITLDYGSKELTDAG